MACEDPHGMPVDRRVLSESEIEWIAERAAILEFEAGLLRQEAERLAREMAQRFFNAKEVIQ